MAKHLVIMAGGVGSRFWPVSTTRCPKQFLDITGCGRTMIQQTCDRFEGVIDMKHTWVVTSANYVEYVKEQLIGIDPQHILLEPCLRNTAPCIAYVSWKIQKEDSNAQIVVAPSDHLVLKIGAFKQAICQGLDFINNRKAILTLGITPSRPDTGYGYIQIGKEECHPICKVKSFREKPQLPTAIEYIQSGSYVWNSGMFICDVNTIVGEIRKYEPEIASVMDRIAPYLFTDNEQEKVNEYFPTCPKISFDYAVMEKTDLAYVEPSEFGWSDLGTWGALYSISCRDKDNNSVIGNNVTMIDSTGCIVRMPVDKQVVLQGLTDFIVAEHNNTLLICQLGEEQRIKDWHN